MRNVVLGEGPLPGYSGARLELVDVKGRFSVNRVVGPFEGDNWTGRFQLRLIGAFGRTQARLDLPASEYTLFMHKFKFSFADYNGDGYSDFALGQYASSDANWYEIYSIEPGGIVRLPVSTGQVFAPPNLDYSPAFKMAGPHAFTTTFYDNADATWFRATYAWTRGEFVETQRPESP